MDKEVKIKLKNKKVEDFTAKLQDSKLGFFRKCAELSHDLPQESYENRIKV